MSHKIEGEAKGLSNIALPIIFVIDYNVLSLRHTVYIITCE